MAALSQKRSRCSFINSSGIFPPRGSLVFEPYAFAVPRGDSSFRLAVNTALTQVYASGEIEKVFGPWLGKLGRPSGLLAAMYLLNSSPQ